MTKQDVRCTVFISAELNQRLAQLQKPHAKHRITRSDLIRDAIIRDAIIQARRDGETLLAQIQAVRELEIQP
jgi:hypothetical protein